VAKRKRKDKDEAAAKAETPVAESPVTPEESAPTVSVDASSEKIRKGSERKRGKRKTRTVPTEMGDESEAPTQSAPPISGSGGGGSSDEFADPSEAKTAGSKAVLIATVGEPHENGSEPETQTAAEGPGESDDSLSPEELARTVEALLFAAEEPIAPREIARASGSDSATIRKVIAALKEKYEVERRPWEVVEVAGGHRLMSRPEFFPAITRLKTQSAQRKLTQAALETLALIAYRQPIGRAEVETVRGVNAGPVLRQLLDKKLIRITGRGSGLGQPLLYGTTDYFLEHFGIKSTQELPKPGEFKNT